jgi:hypothetical protein
MSDQVWIKFPLPREIREDFKLLCWANSTTMTKKLTELIKTELEREASLVEEAKNLKRNSGAIDE